MATIKSFTDISQSKVLAEILPLESADQTWARIAIAGANLDVPEELQYRHNGDMPFQYYSGIGTPCWSLASLLDVIKKYGLIDLRFLSSTFDGRGEHLMNIWCCTFDNINTVSFDFYADNPVDACMAMIEKLRELKML